MIKHVIVCGDDFGMNADIDEAMISLAGLGRMSAVSCLTLGPTFQANAARLAMRDIDLGLHLNLTEALSDGAETMPPLSRLIMRAYAGRLDAAWVDAQLERQFDAFEAAFGRMPDYVDGHQHVHQLPVVRQRLLALLKRRYGGRMPWLRQTAPGMLSGIPLKETFKAHVIGALGAPRWDGTPPGMACAPTGACWASMDSRAASGITRTCCRTGLSMPATATC